MKTVNLNTALSELLKSLEYNSSKEESFVGDLLKKYSIQRQKTLAKTVQSILSKIDKEEITFEDVFSDVLTYLRLFSIMIEEIYTFLNDYATTIDSRASQFKFNFEKMQQKITFDITNFPRELVRTVGYQEISKFFRDFEINLGSKGDYAEDKEEKYALDFINCYDNDFYNYFLTPVSYFWIIKEYSSVSGVIDEFKILESELGKVFDKIKVLLNLLFEEFQIKPKQIKMPFLGQIQDAPPEICAQENTILLQNGFDYRDMRSKNRDTSRVIDQINCLALALQFWENQYKRDDLGDHHWSFTLKQKMDSISNPYTYINLIKNEITKYEKALDDLLIFKGFKEKKILVEKIEEFVKLPFWKNRWHIYELWTLIFCLKIAKKRYEIALNFKEHSECLELNIPKAAAREPVASIFKNNEQITCWFQRKTHNPITGKGLEPDLRFMTNDPYPLDIFIIENKDRRKCSGKHVTEVKKKYVSGTVAKDIWIVNYEGYQTKKYFKLYQESIDGSNVWISSNFKPTNIPLQFFIAFNSMLDCCLNPIVENLLNYDIIIDNSGSMADKPIFDSIENIFSILNYDPGSVYLFNTELKQLDLKKIEDVTNFVSTELVCEGGTDVDGCIEQYLYSKQELPQIVYVITDGDSQVDYCKKHSLATLEKGASLVFIIL